MQPTTDKIFVSYSRHDEAFARKLAVWLANTLSLGVWIDIDDIQPGVKWSTAIQDGLDNCEVMVVIVTPESMESVNVEDEWQYFIDLGKPVVPILLRSAPIPYQLRRIQWIDFSDRDEYNNSLRQLIVELRQHLKPLDSEAGKQYGRPASSNATVVKSRKAKKTQKRQRQAEDLIEQQSRALKRTNRLVTFLVTILVLVALGAGGAFAWFYFTQPPLFYIQGDTTNAVAILANDQIVTVASLGGVARQGTSIRSGDEPLQLFSESGKVETVLQPDAIVSVNALTDEELDLEVTSGNVSAATNGVQGNVSLQNGVNIAINNNIEVDVDAESDEVTSSCFDGECTVTDESGNTVNLAGGESITFSNSAPNILEAVIRRIAGEVAYVTNRHGAAEIYLMRPDGSNQFRLTDNVQIDDRQPAWSPDGETIAFVSNRGGNLDIWTLSMTEDDAEPTNITDSFNQDSEPVWSPDGMQIAFVSNRVNGIDQIFVMNADGSDVVPITTSGGESPTWSPDGTFLAYSSRRDGNDEIYLLNVREPNSEPINISNHPDSDTDPAWSPDGRNIAFVSDRDNQLEIYVQDVALESDAVNVSLDGGRDFEPVWSPNSQRLMFTSERYSDLDIISVSVNVPVGSTQAVEELRVTTESSASDQQAAWLPIIRAGQ